MLIRYQLITNHFDSNTVPFAIPPTIIFLSKWFTPCEFHLSIRFYDLRYQLVNKRTEILPLATSRIAIAHLCIQFNHGFVLLISMISMPYFKSINFYQNRPKIKLFLPKNIKFSSSEGSAPRPPKQPPPPPLQISGYVLEFNHVFALLISTPPEFSLMLPLKCINFYQNKPKI